jgi:hypothetical protein
MHPVLKTVTRRGAGVTVGTSLAVAALVAAPPAVAAGEATYVLTDLGRAGTGATASAAGLSDAGIVVGTGRTTAASRPQVGLRWYAGGGAPSAMALLPGSTFARAFDVNPAGMAVGEAFNAAGSSVAVAWDASGEISSVGSLNKDGTGVANDVDAAGVVVGSSYNGSLVRAYRSNAAGLEELPVPDVDTGQSVAATVATAVADTGTIVGWASVLHPADADEPVAHSVQTPAVWFGDGSRQLLVSPGGHDSTAVATGVSERDTIVGYSTTAGTDTGVRWGRGNITPLQPVEDPATPGKAWRHSRALAVQGDVAVGYSSKFAGSYANGGSATIWVGGAARDLNDLVDVPAGWTLQAATDINRAGQISGVASVDGAAKAFVLTPVGTPVPTETVLSIGARAATYGRASTVTVTAGPGTTGDVTLTSGRRTLGTQRLVEGVATFRIDGTALEPGRRTLTARYAGSASRTATESSAQVTVRKARAAVRATASRARVVVDRTRRTVKIRVRADGVAPTGSISVRSGGRRIAAARLRDGVATLRLPAFARTGTQRVHVRYAGSVRVAPSSTTVKIRVRSR